MTSLTEFSLFLSLSLSLSLTCAYTHRALPPPGMSVSSGARERKASQMGRKKNHRSHVLAGTKRRFRREKLCASDP